MLVGCARGKPMTIALIHPGPTLCIYRDGALMMEIPLTYREAIGTAGDLLKFASEALALAETAGKGTE